MFDKLRNKFILSNMVISSTIILTAFATVFTVISASLSSPRILAASTTWLDDNSAAQVRELLEDRITLNNREHLANIAFVLIFVGLAVEALVFVASCYMAEKSISPIRESYARQKEFIANASHELKTPIAIVQANFEALDTQEQPWTENIENNLTRANNLINDLLLLAKADSSKEVVQKIDTNIPDLVKKQVKGFQPKLTKKTLKLKIKGSLVISLNSSDLTQIINILLDNAIKYSDNFIEVGLTGKTITITNDGKAVPKHQIDKIFDRFYQLDKTAEGSGLGLAIAKGLSAKNNWSLTATSKKGLTTFHLSL
ncbi:MAG: HAMP domain-containing histidine kinase [Candidatus Nomurabacteria bacterium]|jgi:signal transduction histidine kinase|nr:HAMP domain-containing histidine kinase [Candidatus Nomurabacteria bacterium]